MVRNFSLNTNDPRFLKSFSEKYSKVLFEDVNLGTTESSSRDNAPDELVAFLLGKGDKTFDRAELSFPG